MAQVDFLDVGIGRAAHTNHVVRVTVQVERMTEIVLLDFIYQDNFDDRVQWDINRVGAHAVRAAIWWTVIAVAELLRWDVLDLGQHW